VPRRGDRFRFWGALAVLVAAQFALRPRMGDSRWTPDFMLIAVLFLALRTRPAYGAIAGFIVGLMTDAVSPTAFGAAALATTLVGFGAGWVKALFVADNLLVNVLFVFSASWLRDIIQVLASNQLKGGALLWQLLAWSPLAALATAAAAVIFRLLFRGWLDPKSSYLR
jgi:rod shape-determining protein MreD